MTLQTERPEILYPDSDGKPMADNTLQYEWIVTIKGGLDALFRNDPDVFVAGDLLWYPVEGDNRTRLAPDALVAFGRPKGYRGSYMQWLEDGIAPQVVFEVLSPSNTRAEMARKREWYERYGVEEYYEYDPDRGTLAGWRRQGGQWAAIPEMQGWISPRLGVEFGLEGTDLVLIGPNGKRFESFVQQVEKREQAEQRIEQVIARSEQAVDRAELAEKRAEQAEARFEQVILRAEQAVDRAESAEKRAEQERARAERLAARLKELGLSEE